MPAKANTNFEGGTEMSKYYSRIEARRREEESFKFWDLWAMRVVKVLGSALFLVFVYRASQVLGG